MAVDTPTPLCSAADFQSGPFADLVASYDSGTLAQLCIEASRACETEVTRRLMPFTVTESHRAEGIDVDELGVLGSGIPLDLNATLGASYAASVWAAGSTWSAASGCPSAPRCTPTCGPTPTWLPGRPPRLVGPTRSRRPWPGRCPTPAWCGGRSAPSSPRVADRRHLHRRVHDSAC